MLTRSVHRLLVLAQRDEARVPEVKVGGPLNEFELADEHRPEPPALFHLGGGEPLAPPSAFLFGKIGEGAGLDLQRPQTLHEFHSQGGREAIARPAGIEQFAFFVISDDERVEIPAAWRVAADEGHSAVDEEWTDFAGDLPVPAVSDLLYRQGRTWTVTRVITSSRRTVPVYQIFLADNSSRSLRLVN